VRKLDHSYSTFVFLLLPSHHQPQALKTHVLGPNTGYVAKHFPFLIPPSFT
jgi:hypothetical protein